MTLLKSGITFSPMIVSKMVYSCNTCNHVDIVSGKDFDPSAERKCPKCESQMILQSTNADIYDPPPQPNDMPFPTKDSQDSQES